MRTMIFDWTKPNNEMQQKHEENSRNAYEQMILQITGIPEGEKVTVIDRDTEGIESNKLTQIDCRDALVTTWKGEPHYEVGGF